MDIFFSSNDFSQLKLSITWLLSCSLAVLSPQIKCSYNGEYSSFRLGSPRVQFDEVISGAGKDEPHSQKLRLLICNN